MVFLQRMGCIWPNIGVTVCLSLRLPLNQRQSAVDLYQDFQAKKLQRLQDRIVVAVDAAVSRVELRGGNAQA